MNPYEYIESEFSKLPSKLTKGITENYDYILKSIRILNSLYPYTVFTKNEDRHNFCIIIKKYNKQVLEFDYFNTEEQMVEKLSQLIQKELFEFKINQL